MLDTAGGRRGHSLTPGPGRPQRALVRGPRPGVPLSRSGGAHPASEGLGEARIVRPREEAKIPDFGRFSGPVCTWIWVFNNSPSRDR